MKFTILFVLLTGSLAFAFISGNNTINKNFKETSYRQDLQHIFETESQEDTTLMPYIEEYITQAKEKGVRLYGKTYKEVIDRARQLRKTETLSLSHTMNK